MSAKTARRSARLEKQSRTGSSSVSDADGTPIDTLPDELLLHVFTFVGSKTLLTSVHGVCRRWRATCGNTPRMWLDLTFLTNDAPLARHRKDGIGVRMALALVRRWKRIIGVHVGSSTSGEGIMIALAPHCPHLSVVIINNTAPSGREWTDVGLVSLAVHCPRLTAVKFASCSDLTDLGVTTLAEQCHQLKSVELFGCAQLTDASVLAMAKHCPGITTIVLCGFTSLSDDAVVALAEACTQLDDIFLANTPVLTDRALLAIARNCPGLLSISLRGIVDPNMAVTDAGVCALAKHCKHLSRVSFPLCTLLTSAAVIALAKGCPMISYVDFSHCPLMTNEAVSVLVENCSFVRSITFNGCGQLTTTVVVSLALYIHSDCVFLHTLLLLGCDGVDADALDWLVSRLAQLKVTNGNT
jgi:hypothetical protein